MFFVWGSNPRGRLPPFRLKKTLLFVRHWQKTTATAVVFVYGGGEPSLLSASRRRHIAFAKGKNIVSSLLYGALPGDASYASLLTNRLSQAAVGCLMLAYSFSPRVHSIPRGPRIFARNDVFLSATCQRQKHRIIAFACTLLLFFRKGKTVRNTDGFLLFGFIVFCWTMLCWY